MILALAAAGLLLLLLPGLTGTWASRRVAPRELARLCTASLLLGVVALVAAMGLAAVPAMASLLDVPGVVDHCRGALAPLADDPTMVSWIAGVGAVWLVARFARGASRSVRVARRARVEPWLGEHRQRSGFDLVVVPTAELVAFGVPGAPPQIVVSRGLLDVLDATETAAVIEHEMAHHRLRHWRHLVVLAGVERAASGLPLVGRGLDAARSALEEWADEESTSERHHRESLRRALRGMAVITGRTRDRLRRLEAPRPRQPGVVRLATYVPLVVAGLTLVLLVAGWFSEAHHAFALGEPCDH